MDRMEVQYSCTVRIYSSDYRPDEQYRCTRVQLAPRSQLLTVFLPAFLVYIRFFFFFSLSALCSFGLF